MVGGVGAETAVGFAASSGAAPSGFGILYHDLTTQVPAIEYTLRFSFPLFLGLSLGGATRVPGTLLVDGLGAGSETYLNPGGLEGLFTLQVLVFDDAGMLVGSSSTAAF